MRPNCCPRCDAFRFTHPHQGKISTGIRDEAKPGQRHAYRCVRCGYLWFISSRRTRAAKRKARRGKRSDARWAKRLAGVYHDTADALAFALQTTVTGRTRCETPNFREIARSQCRYVK